MISAKVRALTKDSNPETLMVAIYANSKGFNILDMSQYNSRGIELRLWQLIHSDRRKIKMTRWIGLVKTSTINKSSVQKRKREPRQEQDFRRWFVESLNKSGTYLVRSLLSRFRLFFFLSNRNVLG